MYAGIDEAQETVSSVGRVPLRHGGRQGPLSVVHLVSALHAGGIERLLLSMSPHWDRTKHSIETWCLNSGSSRTYLDKLRERGMQVREIGTIRRGGIEPRVVWHLSRELGAHHKAIVHSHTPYPLCVAMLARFLCRTKVIHIHHQHALPSRYQILSMKTLGRIVPPDAIISVSRSNAEALEPLTDPSKCRLSTIPNGIEIPPAGEPRLPRHLARVYTATRLSAVKNVEVLIVAMKQVIGQCPEAELNILGDGELRESLKAKALQLGIQDRVHFHGYVFQPEKYYAGFGIFVLPSLSEGMSLALLEAMASGKPCIATEVGGNPEILRNEEDGLLVPSNDPATMANAILRLISNPVLASRLGGSARLRAVEFDIRRTVQRIQELYDDIVRECPSRQRDGNRGRLALT